MSQHDSRLKEPLDAEARKKFGRFVSSGVLFQGGAATVDTATLVAALVHGLTGSSFAVGAAAAISRYGWLFSQIFVAYRAQKRPRRMRYYAVGALGRATGLGALAALLWFGGGLPVPVTVAAFFLLWTAYCLVGGIVAVPYNDIVARSIPSSWRSRLLAYRFFGGGILAMIVAGVAHRILGVMPFPLSYAAIFLLGTVLLFLSSFSFLSAGEKPAPVVKQPAGFGAFLAGGFQVFGSDRRFRAYLYTRWLAALVGMAIPFYILQAKLAEITLGDVALFFGMQTAGSLVSNPIWGWYGDRRGKAPLLLPVAILGALVPILTLGWIGSGLEFRGAALLWFGLVFFVIGVGNNGDTIAHLGFLMEISPDAERPAYSGYFSLFAAPAALLPMAGGLVAEVISLPAVFAISLGAAMLQLFLLRRLFAVHRGRQAPPPAESG
ncbi:MAG: MFS transporter [bacterium]